MHLASLAVLRRKRIQKAAGCFPLSEYLVCVQGANELGFVSFFGNNWWQRNGNEKLIGNRKFYEKKALTIVCNII